MTIKEQEIRNYISEIDFKSGNWSLKEMSENMRRFLGEEPGIDVEYVSSVLINEDTDKAYEIKELDKITIVFFDMDEKFKKLEFKIGV